MRKKCGCKKKKLGPQRQRRGKAGKVLNKLIFQDFAAFAFSEKGDV